jgi:hypothetical protein
MMLLGRLELRELNRIKWRAGISRDTTAGTLFVIGVTRTPELDFKFERRERDSPRSGGSKSYLFCVAIAVTEDAGSLDASGSTRTRSKCSAESQGTGRGSPAHQD